MELTVQALKSPVRMNWECAFLYNLWNYIPGRWSLKIKFNVVFGKSLKSPKKMDTIFCMNPVKAIVSLETTAPFLSFLLVSMYWQIYQLCSSFKLILIALPSWISVQNIHFLIISSQGFGLFSSISWPLLSRPLGLHVCVILIFTL